MRPEPGRGQGDCDVQLLGRCLEGRDTSCDPAGRCPEGPGKRFTGRGGRVPAYIVSQLGRISLFQVSAAFPMLSSSRHLSSSCLFLLCASFSSRTRNRREEENAC